VYGARGLGAALAAGLVALSVATSAAIGAPGNIEIDEFARNAQDGAVADLATRRLVLQVQHPSFTNHYGGTLQFGPDGFMYAGTGDGGGAGDPGGNARNLNVLLGKLLRLDVSPDARGSAPYAIPATNPAASNPRCTGGWGTTACPEVVASGLRNPFRFSFDPQSPNDLWIGDVGQGLWEEIDHVGVAGLPGTSFGWDCMEGNSTYASPTPTTGCPPPDYVGPVFAYSHDGSLKAITGGMVVRDPALTPLLGRFLYTDFYFSTLHSLDPSDNSDRVESSLSESQVVSINKDAAGHVYVVSLSGAVKRVACDAPCTSPSDLTLVNAYTDSVSNPVNAPIFVTAAPGDTSHLFIVERGGRIRIATDSGSGYVVQDTPFLDIQTEVNTDGEGGLLSMAFDPEYAQTGLFYIYFVNFGSSTAPQPSQPPPSTPPSGTPPSPASPSTGSGAQPAEDTPNPLTPSTAAIPPDVLAPVMHIRAARRQNILRRGFVRVSVACNEACSVRVSGRGRGRALQSVLERLTAGKRVIFDLRISRALRRALLHRGTIVVTIRGRDTAGNLRTSRLVVRVKRP
jgi:hypothetical protein